MLTSARPGVFGHFAECQVVAATHAYSVVTSDRQKRVARLRELAREFRKILKECTEFDGGLPETLREVIADLEEEADRLERDPHDRSTLSSIGGRVARWGFGGLPD